MCCCRSFRQDSITDKWYDCSSHMLWVGERTRQLDHAHIAFVRGINNPVGIKISDKATPEELLQIIDAVNPDNIPGRVTIIVRMGSEKLKEKLPNLIRAVQREGLNVFQVFFKLVVFLTIQLCFGLTFRPSSSMVFRSCAWKHNQDGGWYENTSLRSHKGRASSFFRCT